MSVPDLIPQGAPAIAPATEVCARCGQEIARRGKPWDACPRCGHVPRQAMHGFTPSQPAAEPTRARATEVRDARAAFETERGLLTATLIAVEQSLRNAKLRAERVGVATEVYAGRARESVRDELLGPVRQQMFQVLRRLETLL